MRRFGRTPDRELSDYQRGYRTGAIHAVTTLIGLAIGVRALLWASRNPVIETLVTWATTPQLSPLDLVPVVLILAIAWMANIAMRYFGGLSA